MLITPVWKGQIPYQTSLLEQESLKNQAQKTRKAFLMGFECPACITLGLRGSKSLDLIYSEEEYLKKGITIVPINRGGQATLHSLGQLVIYPIMDLLKWKMRPRDFLSFLEEVTQETCQTYGVTVKKLEKLAGLWTNKGKMAFFGIHISRGVSQHGLSLNVQNDLTLFDSIRSCGQAHRRHDSLESHGVNVGLKKVFNTWCQVAQLRLMQKIT